MLSGRTSVRSVQVVRPTRSSTFSTTTMKNAPRPAAQPKAAKAPTTTQTRASRSPKAPKAPTQPIHPAFAPRDTFVRRHIGSNDAHIQEMCEKCGVKDLDELIDKTVPKNIRRPEMNLGEPKSESEALQELRQIAEKNQILKSMIGQGYYDTILPSVIQRNILENPGWYTPYTPYQAEISQGRLESLLNWQTMVSDLTGLPIANASLLDEGTAAAEAMNLCFNNSRREVKAFFVSSDVHPQTIAIIQTRADPIGVKVIVGDPESFDFSKEKVCGALIQYPGTSGRVTDYAKVVEKAHAEKALVVCATDLMALTLLKTPAEIGVDVVIGSGQRFGTPMSYGGPHAAFFAVKDEYKRIMPGRLIGMTRDAQNKPAIRMALQTREQHIRREKATSNICTAQALLASINAMYAIYHGPKGLKDIAQGIHRKAVVLAEGLAKLNYEVNKDLKPGDTFFDTITVTIPKGNAAKIVKDIAAKKGINLRCINEKTIGISVDETTTEEHVNALLSAFKPPKSAAVDARELAYALEKENKLDRIEGSAFERKTPYLTHPIFNKYHQEHEMLRYITRLEKKDIALTSSMISLGSCTMKLSAASEMYPITWPEFTKIHPFVPAEQAEGYHQMIKEIEKMLSEITGFSAVTVQPNAGSQGEYTGLMVIRKYHISNGQPNRNVCLIPVSAHGTNPASCAMAGMNVVPVACDKDGNVDLNDLREKAKQYEKDLAMLMITYPSTHGVFEESIKEICTIVKNAGGLVYMDGANMNAQVGITCPSFIGADVCHLNLHKTFAIPHGGGGPGVGPIGVRKELAPFLPNSVVVPGVGGKNSIGPVASAPFGSAGILPITYMYIKMMGASGLKKATQVAILNANYLAKSLSDYYPIVYKGVNGFVGHEFILDCRQFHKVDATDVAKRLMDYGFHAPTLAFPIPGTLMVEPTESESKAELDRFIEAMIQIRKEIADVEEGRVDPHNNLLKNAPHTADVVASDKWDRPYSREVAAFPVPRLRESKVWPTVSRIDGVYGDKNLVLLRPEEGWMPK